MSEENREDVTALPPTPCSVLEAVRGMVRDRQYEITVKMDAAPAKDFPIENEAWQRVKHELEAVADLCNRMIYRISSEERQRASCPEDSSDGDALAIPRSSGDSSPNDKDLARRALDSE
jgi:hypothetical protein